MNLTLVTDATAADEPVTLAEAKAYLRVDADDDVTLIESLITAARQLAEGVHGRELAKKTYKLSLNGFPRGTNASEFRNYIELLDPLISVASVQYTDKVGAVTTMVSGTDYSVDASTHPGRIVLPYGKAWPAADLATDSPVKIQFTAGFTPASVPVTCKQAILMLISLWYNARLPVEALRFAAEIPWSVTVLLQQDRLHRF